MRNNHDKFILSPVLNILQETMNACNGIGSGIETQSLSDYVMQTTFLKMTGASEQKLKCICWEMATNDYTYRYQYLKKNYGECSSYEDKNSVYADLLKSIKKINPQYSIDSLFDDVEIISHLAILIEDNIKYTKQIQEQNKKRKLTDEEYRKLAEEMTNRYRTKGLCDKERNAFCRRVMFLNIKDEIESVLANSVVLLWKQQDYSNYIKLWERLSTNTFANEDVLLNKELRYIYSNKLYVHRNRCAHNLTSYQNNLPTIKTLVSSDYMYENYYIYISLLILIDEIYIRLYKVYKEVIENVVY